MTFHRLSAPTVSSEEALLLERSFSRRALMRAAAGAAGAAAGAQMLGPGAALARQRRTSRARAIPGGFEHEGKTFHGFEPTIGQIQSTIRDFNGAVGTLDARGVGMGNDGREYHWAVDMRFLKGVYVAENRRRYNAAFGFISLDVFDGPVGTEGTNQLHHWNPGIAPNVLPHHRDDVATGVYETVRVPPRTVSHVDPGAGRARFRLHGFELWDQFENSNALSDSPRQALGECTFDIRWSGGGRRRRVRSRKRGFSGLYRSGPATIEWSARNAEGFELTSTRQTETPAAFVGREANGLYTKPTFLG